jgi:hypothetical protein
MLMIIVTMDMEGDFFQKESLRETMKNQMMDDIILISDQVKYNAKNYENMKINNDVVFLNLIMEYSI